VGRKWAGKLNGSDFESCDFSQGANDMGILVAIAGWIVGSIVFGLVLGRIVGMAANRRRAEEQFIASLEIGDCKLTSPPPGSPRSQERDAPAKSG
jgi:hypothetical protein